VVVPCILILSKSVQSESLTPHSVPYTYEQGLDIICSHISEQSKTTYFNRMF